MTYSMKNDEWPHTDLTQERFRDIDMLARDGDAQAFFLLGYFYEYGKGDIVKRHPYRAVYCYRQASHLGHGQASMRTGKIHQFGELEATQCDATAGMFYRLAVERGIAGAEECLAVVTTEVRRQVEEQQRKQAESRASIAAIEEKRRLEDESL